MFNRVIRVFKRNSHVCKSDCLLAQTVLKAIWLPALIVQLRAYQLIYVWIVKEIKFHLG